MRKRWRYGPLRSPAAALATRQCCRTCSTRSHQTRNWAALLPSFGSNAPAGQWMEPTTRANATILVQPAMPIPPRKNAKPWKPTSDGAIARNDAVNAQRYLGWTLWRRWSGYHRRSSVETKMHCMKLLGQSLMARDFDGQVAEIQVSIAVLNRYTALGIPVTEPVG